jgi:uncharacterized protein YlxP (DUF503 family)
MIIQKAQARLRARFNFSIAELDHQDLWQRCRLGAVTIGRDRKTLERVVSQFITESEHILNGDLLDYQVEFIE